MPTEPADPFEIAYIMKEFPRLSETFISNEIYQLEKAGTRLRVFSVKKPGIQKHHEAIDQLKSPVIYLPEVGSLSRPPFSNGFGFIFPSLGEITFACSDYVRAFT
ncbi:MAG: hypothetical protein MPW14_24910 (plasmid) [Candidatus Manganitrophus sp.]|nr:MAG: hypothetical protein MPW14_24910 [Candidatus Manganitrophus sp.]